MDEAQNQLKDDADSYGPLSDAALTELAETIFLELDARENEDAEHNAAK